MGELVSSLVLRVISGFFQADLLPENVVVGPDSKIRSELLLDDLGLEELAEFCRSSLCVSSVTGVELETCVTLADAACVVAGKLTSALPNEQMLAWADLTLPTVWTQELRGRLNGSCGSGCGKDEKMFSRLRKAAHDLSRAFVFHWKNLSEQQQVGE
jgi:hypothetical protein